MRTAEPLEEVLAVLRREHGLLDQLRFRFLEVRLLLAAAEVRYLGWATTEVAEARRRAREADLLRAAALHRLESRGATPTLRAVAAGADEPWAGMLRDHHEGLCTVVSEIEVIGHRNAELARAGITALAHGVALSSLGRPPSEAGEAGDLATEAAFQEVIGTAGRLRMPALLAFLR